MLRILSIVISFALISGCATTSVPVPEDIQSQLTGKSITTANWEVPGFTALTAGKAMFGALGAVAMVSAGNKIVKDNAITDPAKYISDTLATSFAQKYNAKINTNTEVLKSYKAAKVASQLSSSNLVLDVRTTNWGFGYFPTDWNNYSVFYSANLRLIDTVTKKAIAKGSCIINPKQTENAPSKVELLADNAERIKAELKNAANECIEKFSSEVLNLK